MTTRWSLRRKGVVAFLVAMAMVLMLTASAFAKGGPPAGRGGGRGSGHGGGGGGGETTVSNNLSVPAIMVGGGFTGVTCGASASEPSTLLRPTGDPKTGFEVAGYYYVQGESKWQAQCYTAASAMATAAWGDNLTGGGKLSTGSPIRVELGLNNSDTAVSSTLQGYTVVKLNTTELDRLSPYGTQATQNADGTFSDIPTTFANTSVRVFAAGVTFSIQNLDTSAYVINPGTPATAEINATGTVVYGYNLRVQTAGKYQIIFTIPNVTITGSDAGSFTASTVTLDITVTSGSGGGGGGGGGQ